MKETKVLDYTECNMMYFGVLLKTRSNFGAAGASLRIDFWLILITIVKLKLLKSLMYIVDIK